MRTEYTETEDLFIVNRGNPAGLRVGTLVERTEDGWEEIETVKAGRNSIEPYGYKGFVLPHRMLDGCVMKMGGKPDERGLERPRIDIYT